jgi:murein DD-endopeptidase MepM/ murein hydrolase activator NlpD
MKEYLFFKIAAVIVIMASLGITIAGGKTKKPERGYSENNITRQTERRREQVPEKETGARFTRYEVREKESIAGIAEKSGLKQGSIISANRVTDMRRTASVLFIPEKDGVTFFLENTDTKTTERFILFLEKNNEITGDIQKIESGIFGLSEKYTVYFVPRGELEKEEIERVYGEYYYYPVAGEISSPYGERENPFDTARTAFHNGIDIAAGEGTPVRAGKYGRITETGVDEAFGNYIVIAHSGGYKTFYGHLASIDIKNGDEVMTGDRIGSAGNTGKSTGAHLHFTVLKDSVPVNPLAVLRE